MDVGLNLEWMQQQQLSVVTFFKVNAECNSSYNKNLNQIATNDNGRGLRLFCRSRDYDATFVVTSK